MAEPILYKKHMFLFFLNSAGQKKGDRGRNQLKGIHLETCGKNPVLAAMARCFRVSIHWVTCAIEQPIAGDLLNPFETSPNQ